LHDLKPSFLSILGSEYLHTLPRTAITAQKDVIAMNNVEREKISNGQGDGIRLSKAAAIKRHRLLESYTCRFKAACKPQPESRNSNRAVT
jgi:hypothetical protein